MNEAQPAAESMFSGKKPLVFALIAVVAGLVVALVMNPEKKKSAAPPVPAMAGGGAAGEPKKSSGVPVISDLLPGLEAKVAANPNDMNLRILLAQTYGELGQRDKGLALMRKMRGQFPMNQNVAFVLGAMLMKGSAEADQREALKLFEESAKSDVPNLENTSRLYQGQVMVKLGNAKGAAKLWRDYIAKLPKGDERRKQFEAELVKLPVS
jgi:cytochrome c-type biogenesis protein CcmH/NrfG